MIKESDILHLHWINQGFLSLKDLHKLLRTGKPVVWTIHDMWAFTGGCHYSGECENYISGCGECPFLRTHKWHDLSYRIFKKKEILYKDTQITFVAPSEWLAEKARQSALAGSFSTVVIPNPIDTEIFRPEDKSAIRKIKSLPEDKFLILAGSANLKEKRKGFKYLLNALDFLFSQKPNLVGKIGLVTFGKSDELTELPCEVFNLSYMKDEESVAMVYQLADVYVLPSLEDNLPSTVMESLSCGTPVVAFNTGGIPDMVEHRKNGYLTETGNVEGLSEGILWIFEHQDINGIRRICREKVMQNYTYEIIAKKYYSLYQSLT
jgi:glycosyltransferase involved in cell wall biosynthesis